VKTFKSIFPYNQTVLAEYPVMSLTDIADKIQNAERAFQYWQKESYDNRSQILHRVASLLTEQKHQLARLITDEMGKVYAEAMGEIEKCAGCCIYYADHAEEFLVDEVIDAGYHRSFVSYQPIGAVFAIMPWNFPFWQVFRFAAPTIMAGNVALLKHAPNVCGCALAIEKIFSEAGMPDGVFQALIIDTDVTEQIIKENIVQAVTLTGSEAAGSSVASLAGKHIKKSVLELGGSDAFIVLDDADIKRAAKVALQSRFLNAGQSCIAAKRFIILEKSKPAFMEALLQEMQHVRQGDPLAEHTTVGPMARIDLADKLSQQLTQTLKSGAALVSGGQQDGCNFIPALLDNVQTDMVAFREETFGPLLAMTTVRDEQTAITLANQSSYGLGGSIWTTDIEKGLALARNIHTGAVFINSLVKSDVRLPFGGVKKSGYGRELGRHGILEFVNVKTITASV
jgi:succinate-semialdehyde dehydrogenase/glutarate-semialdehyde dehydrogenase